MITNYSQPHVKFGVKQFDDVVPSLVVWAGALYSLVWWANNRAYQDSIAAADADADTDADADADADAGADADADAEAGPCAERSTVRYDPPLSSIDSRFSRVTFRATSLFGFRSHGPSYNLAAEQTGSRWAMLSAPTSTSSSTPPPTPPTPITIVIRRRLPNLSLQWCTVGRERSVRSTDRG